ncbi:MAG: hypothetical protein JW828_09305 [Sedimentisphaerales bacterium]|nr:hypothetical protein [Sedimentisphaerales bacterium]
MPEGLNRRSFLAASAAGAMIGLSMEERALLAAGGNADSASSPNRSIMAVGRIGKVAISRLICGGNLLNGFAHSRDLIYVSSLVKQYHTDEKILDTWQLCEDNGINTMISTVDCPYAGGSDPTLRMLDRYRRERKGKMQWLAQCEPSPTDLTGDSAKAIDNGAVATILQGERGDRWVRENRLDLIEKFVEYGKKRGVLVGVACHSIDVPIALEASDIGVDLYMKTIHHENYWSNRPDEPRREIIENFRDNYWSLDPQTTIEVMGQIQKPWIAYKVLAAGAIPPQSGFDYAFQGGADFLCVGMFDFQVEEDVRIARAMAEKHRNRPRPWRA